jgi:glycosyltransferase involved in cell wall biosynthesis
MQRVSIVIPIFEEEKNIIPLFERLVSVTKSIDQCRWEFIMVNDGSNDGSLDVMKGLAERDKRVKVLDLSRNFGKEIALTAGVHNTDEADAVICIDADLQHPPELILEFIERWRAGAEIVVSVRTYSERQPILKRIGSHLFYWMMSRISQTKMVSQTTDFRLYDAKVISAFKLATERDRMFRGIMDWLGFRRVYVEFAATSRRVGKVGYSYTKLISLAVASVLSFSHWPLRLTGIIGVVISIVSGGVLAWMLLNILFGEEIYFTPLAIVLVVNTFLIGIVLVAIGLVALYLGSVHTESINRPLYVIRERIN